MDLSRKKNNNYLLITLLSLSIVSTTLIIYQLKKEKEAQEEYTKNYAALTTQLLDLGKEKIDEKAKIEEYARKYAKLQNSIKESFFNYDRIHHLRIEDLTNNLDSKIFSKSALFNSQPKTDEELYQKIVKQFKAHKIELAKSWKLSNDDLLLTLYFMNVTNQLWGFGNIKNPKKPGCVYDNDSFIPQKPEENSTKFYLTLLTSDIGCCNDYADFLQFLVTKAQLKNRKVLVPDHIFNEVSINGKWMTFDASVNFWWHEDWNSIQTAPSDHIITVTTFPSEGTVLSHPNYRPLQGKFRTLMLLKGAQQNTAVVKYIYDKN